MSMVLIVVVLLLLFGGGGYYGDNQYGGRGSGGVLGIVCRALVGGCLSTWYRVIARAVSPPGAWPSAMR
jgi:hypothetical protein